MFKNASSQLSVAEIALTQISLRQIRAPAFPAFTLDPLLMQSQQVIEFLGV